MTHTLSGLLYDAIWHSPRSSQLEPLAVPNGLGREDYFVFASECDIHTKYDLLRGLVGSRDLPLIERVLWDRRLGSLEHIYRRFFKRGLAHIPAFWWVWNRVPARSLNSPGRVMKRQDLVGGVTCDLARDRSLKVQRLGLSDGKVLDFPTALLRPVDGKLNRRISFQRLITLADRNSGQFLAREFHDEVQLGSEKNIEVIRRGILDVGSPDAVVSPLLQSSSGSWYFDNYTIYLVRALPVHEREYGQRYSLCRFEAVYVSYRLIGSANKIGVVHGDFNTWAQARQPLCEALHLINPFGKWV